MSLLFTVKRNTKYLFSHLFSISELRCEDSTEFFSIPGFLTLMDRFVIEIY